MHYAEMHTALTCMNDSRCSSETTFL